MALGPNGANKKGALTDLLQTTARNFGGQGKKFHQTIEDFGKLSGTLADNKDQLFGSVRQLEGFVRTLSRNDHTVRQFNQTLSQVSGMLEGERGDLASSLHNLGIAMRQVSGFVRDNRAILGKNIAGLDDITQILVKQRGALAETLRNAPLALNNLALTYNPQAGTLDTRANLGEIGNQITSDPSTFLCGILNQADQGGQSCDVIRQILGKNRPGALGGGATRRTTVDRQRPDPRRTGGGRPMTRLRLRPPGRRRPRRGGAGARRAARSTSTSCRSRAARTSATTRSRSPRSSSDVLDLVPQSTVKVNDVTVGKITDVRLQGYHALVTMQLRNDTKLPDNARRLHPADEPAG